MFKRMTRAGNRLRLALDGPAGAGKTYTALRFAFAIAKRFDLKVGVIDTEHGSAKLYVGVTEDETTWQWDGVELQHYAPSAYATAIKAAASHGIGVLVVDSLSHAWSGVGGALDQVDRARGKSGGSFSAWKDVTPQHREMVDAILSFPGHVIATMRTKIEYVLNKDERGKTSVEKVGLRPVQREGVEYEFTLVCDVDQEHRLTVSKTRCPDLDGKIAVKPGAAWLTPLLDWLEGIAPEPPKPTPATTPAPGENTATTVSLRAPGPERVDEATVKEIKRLWVSLEKSREELVALISNFNASTLAELSREDALKILSRLQQRDTERQAEATF